MPDVLFTRHPVEGELRKQAAHPPPTPAGRTWAPPAPAVWTYLLGMEPLPRKGLQEGAWPSHRGTPPVPEDCGRCVTMPRAL